MKNLVWALCLPLAFAGCEIPDRVPTEMVTTSQTQSPNKEKSLDASVRLDVGTLEITSDKQPGSVYSYDLLYDKTSFAPEVQYSSARGGAEGRLYLSLQNARQTIIHPQGNDNKLHIAFTESIPLNLKVNAGIGESHLSLTGLKISRIVLESGVGEAKLTAYEPNAIPCDYIKLKSGVGRFEAVGLANLNFRDLDFEGGVGGATLDFTGELKHNADIRVQVGLGEVNVRIPREIGVKVESAKNFLSGLFLEGFTRQDPYHYSNNYSRASMRVTFHVTTGIGQFRITWL